MDDTTILQWLASALTLLSLWLIGKHDERGWITNGTGSVLWVLYAYQTSQWGLLVLNIVFVVAAAQGYLHWIREGEV